MTASARSSVRESQMQCFFGSVVCAKPKSSRNSSLEAFIVCQDFQPPPDFDAATVALTSGSIMANAADSISMIACASNGNGTVGGGGGSSSETRAIAPFLACGDLAGFDADQSYPLELGDDDGDDGDGNGNGGNGGGGGAFAEFAAFNRSAACVPLANADAEKGAPTASGADENASPSSSSSPSASSSAAARSAHQKYQHIAPLQPPRNAPYSQFLHLKRGNLLGKQ
jgi:hypothetical protein